MAHIHGSAKCVSDGLLCCLDFANPASYPKTGNTVYDISGNNNHFSRHPSAGSFTWQPNNGGRMYFDSAGGGTMLADTTFGSALDYVTFELWMYRIYDTTNDYLWDCRNGTGTWFLTNYSSYNLTWANAITYNDPTVYSADSNLWDRWLHFVAAYRPTAKGDVATFWINGAQVAQITSGLPDNDIGASMTIGTRYTYTGHFYGYMAMFKIYEIGLDETQVQQNYNATKHRFPGTY